MQGVGRRNADEQVDQQTGTGDQESSEHRVVVQVPNLAQPTQGQPAFDSNEIIDGQPGQHRLNHGNDQKRAGEQRQPELEGKANGFGIHGLHPEAATVWPAADRARARALQVISPKKIESAEAMAMLADNVNSV